MEGEPPYIILLIGHFPSQFVLLICSFVCNYNNACTCDLDLKERINETGGKQTFWVQTHAYISYSISLVFFLFVIYSFKSLLLYVVTRTWMKLQIYSAETNIKCFHLVFWSLSVTFVMFFHLVLFSRFFVCLLLTSMIPYYLPLSLSWHLVLENLRKSSAASRDLGSCCSSFEQVFWKKSFKIWAIADSHGLINVLMQCLSQQTGNT